MRATYFFRPIYVSGGRWSFRIYINYTNPNYFYFPRPYHYRTYCGGHYRTDFRNTSYYRGRHNHPTYNGTFRIRNDKSYHTSRRSDFGSVNIRPDSGRRPETNRSNHRSNTNQPAHRSDKKNEVTVPRRENRSQRENVRQGGTRNGQINNGSTRRSNSSSTTTRSSSRSSESSRRK